MPRDVDPWVAPVLEDLDRGGGLVVELPEYRPDLCRALAHQLGLGFFDFRREVMVVRGWEADRVALTALDEVLEDQARRGGAVVHNVEALLACKPEPAGARWIESFLARKWEAPLILPLVVLTDSVPAGHPGVLVIPAEELPEQSLLNRLVS